MTDLPDSAIAGALHAEAEWNAATGNTAPCAADVLAEYVAIPGFDPAEEEQ